MSNCAGNCCETSVSSVTGPKGDPGVKGDTGATGAAGTPYSGLIDVVVGNTATVTLAAADTSSTVYFNRAAGVDVSLPTSPPIGTYFDFVTITAVTSNDYSVAAGSTNTITGSVMQYKSATIPVIAVALSADSINFISLTATLGGLVGTSFRLTYEATEVWVISGSTYGTDVSSTPFSHI